MIFKHRQYLVAVYEFDMISNSLAYDLNRGVLKHKTKKSCF